MSQEFLASFAVDIDESGVNRLQSILSENRELASGLASAFDTARSSLLDFIRSASEDLPSLPLFRPSLSPGDPSGAPGAFAVDLDFSRATKQLESFMAAAKKQMRLSADASGIVSAAAAALSQVRGMFAGANLTLQVRAEAAGAPAASSSSSASSALASPALRLSSGGRFSSPTHAEIAEDGGTEYVVPVKKEQEAVPLVRSLLSELSASARTSLRGALPASDFPLAPPDTLSAAAALPPVQYSASSNVSAPVNIHVEAAAADPEAVGRSIYDTAERYLLRTISGAI